MHLNYAFRSLLISMLLLSPLAASYGQDISDDQALIQSVFKQNHDTGGYLENQNGDAYCDVTVSTSLLSFGFGAIKTVNVRFGDGSTGTYFEQSMPVEELKVLNDRVDEWGYPSYDTSIA